MRDEGMIEVRQCGCCDNYIATYDRWEVERPCPIQAVADCLEAEVAALGEVEK
jgi:hypothetical protein